MAGVKSEETSRSESNEFQMIYLMVRSEDPPNHLFDS